MKYLLTDFVYSLCEQSVKDKIDCDVYRYLKWNNHYKNKPKFQRFNYCLKRYAEFRNVFFYRIQHHRHLSRICRLFFKPADGVEIGGDIGEGLLVSHRFAVVFPKKAGKNFRVGPGAVIGKNKGEQPQIGDNVYIASNATVVGGVHIGDNVIIGAGSVVTKDVPSNGIYAGNPIRLIRDLKDAPELYDEIM